jgi:hypothetical protein
LQPNITVEIRGLEGWTFVVQEFVHVLLIGAGHTGNRDESKHETTMLEWRLLASVRGHSRALRLRWLLRKASKMSGDNVEATVMRVTGEQGDGYLYLVVTTPFGKKAVKISRTEARRVRPGMKVIVYKRGWGLLSEWWLKR